MGLKGKQALERLREKFKAEQPTQTTAKTTLQSAEHSLNVCCCFPFSFYLVLN